MEQPPEFLRCGDVELRRWREDDLETLCQVASESLDHLRPWMPWVEDHGRELYEEFMARSERGWKACSDFRYAITSGGEVIGSCGLRQVGPGAWDIGYWLHPAETGKGFATMAAAALVGAGKRIPGVHRIEIRHDEANPASGAVARRLGFTEAERVREPEGPQAPGEAGVTVVWRIDTQAETEP
ncbi:GNAT family N-acetyltransferase [Streptomyces sp. NPDC046909]|uniref:GNAT family N-acetyltransferase n=1 Tax=Streptomyces sp. NPDC046909 TaxID=3155617 RepID=UPI0033C4E69A